MLSLLPVKVVSASDVETTKKASKTSDANNNSTIRHVAPGMPQGGHKEAARRPQGTNVSASAPPLVEIK